MKLYLIPPGFVELWRVCLHLKKLLNLTETKNKLMGAIKCTKEKIKLLALYNFVGIINFEALALGLLPL